MRLRSFLALSVLVAASACGGEAEAPRGMSAEEVAATLGDIRIEPGLWELTSEVADVRAPDLPREVRTQMIGPRSSLRHCITPEQAGEPSANFLALRTDSDCSYRDFVLQDGRLRGAMTCPNVTATMVGRYQPQGYEMRMEMESPMPTGATMTLQVRARGRRIGDCEAGDSG